MYCINDFILEIDKGQIILIFTFIILCLVLMYIFEIAIPISSILVNHKIFFYQGFHIHEMNKRVMLIFSAENSSKLTIIAHVLA